MTGAPVTLIVIAKAPVPGRVKTRLCPPCTHAEAARLAEAALVDTLGAVAATPSVEPLLVLDGPPGRWVPDGFPIVPQRGDRLDERITAAFDSAGGPALLIGMDTPQVTPAILDDAVRRLVDADAEAVLGLSEDGGFWALGLRAPSARLTLGVPMSTAHTGAAQLGRLVDGGCRVDALARLRDVDAIHDAIHVADIAPSTRFAAVVAELGFAARKLTPA
jgi:hypothetical protein